jgi:hypothetical protein
MPMLQVLNVIGLVFLVGVTLFSSAVDRHTALYTLAGAWQIEHYVDSLRGPKPLPTSVYTTANPR